MKSAFVAVALFTGAACSTMPSRKPAEGLISTAGNALTEEIRPYIRTLSHSIDTYNYVSRESAHVPPRGALNPDDPSLSRYLQSKVDYFWDLAQRNEDNDTGGLYLASDPVASRNFGGDHWLLFRLRLRAGTPFLDLTALGASYVSDATQLKIRAAGCDDPNKYNHLLMKNEGDACRRIGQVALHNLGVPVLFYGWKSVNFHDCPHRKGGAFILLSQSPVEQSQAFFAQSTGFDDERTAIEGLFLQQVSQNGSEGTVSTELRPWTSLDGKAVDLRQWASEHLLFCQ